MFHVGGLGLGQGVMWGLGDKEWGTKIGITEKELCIELVYLV